jgi:hypothetical protein
MSFRVDRAADLLHDPNLASREPHLELLHLFCRSGHQSLTEPKQAFNSCPSRVYRIHDQLRFPKLWHEALALLTRIRLLCYGTRGPLMAASFHRRI